MENLTGKMSLKCLLNVSLCVRVKHTRYDVLINDYLNFGQNEASLSLLYAKLINPGSSSVLNTQTLRLKKAKPQISSCSDAFNNLLYFNLIPTVTLK